MCAQSDKYGQRVYLYVLEQNKLVVDAFEMVAQRLARLWWFYSSNAANNNIQSYSLYQYLQSMI